MTKIEIKMTDLTKQVMKKRKSYIGIFSSDLYELSSGDDYCTNNLTELKTLLLSLHLYQDICT